MEAAQEERALKCSTSSSAHVAELGAADEGLRQRMHAMFPPAAASSEPVPQQQPGGSSGSRELPSLHAVVVQLDGKFITEITHTAALFAELFPPGGRKRLIKVRPLVACTVELGLGWHSRGWQGMAGQGRAGCGVMRLS